MKKTRCCPSNTATRACLSICISAPNLRAAETDGFTVTGCTITGNGGTGLMANQEKGNVTRRIIWSGNTVSRNRDGGICALPGATGRVLNNTAADNQKFDYQLPANIEQSGNH